MSFMQVTLSLSVIGSIFIGCVFLTSTMVIITGCSFAFAKKKEHRDYVK